jgi:glycosyltransferase involved in cell wall biosynthesis
LKARINYCNIIEKESIDIVHSNTSVIFEGAIAAKIKNIPHVWHIHEFLIGHPELSPCIPLPFICEIMRNLSEKIVCVSELTKRQFEIIIDDNQKLQIIYNGVDENNSKINSNFVREMLGIGNDEIIAITVGMLTDRKGYANLLDAAALVQKKGIYNDLYG